MTQESQPGPTRGQSQSQTRRRLAAGEAERGGESGFVHSGDQMGSGEHLQVAGTEPQLLVAVVELGVAGDVAGDDFRGRRSRVKTSLRLRGTVRDVVRCVGPLGTR